MVKPAALHRKTEANKDVGSARAIRGCSGAARILRETHELGRPSLLELTTPAIITGKRSFRLLGGSEGVGGAHSSDNTRDNITRE